MADRKRSKEAITPRYRHMCKPQMVYTFLNDINETRKHLLESTGFGFLMLICEWKRIPGDFVKWVSDNFEPEQCQLRLSKYEALPLTTNDVERVYCLPNGGTPVNPLACKESSILRLRREFKLKLNAQDIDRATVEELEKVILSEKNDQIWCKGVLIYLLGCLLCPDHNDTVSLKYAHIIEDLSTVCKFNWCTYILEHLREGTKGYKTPKADLHLLMIHYIEKMGPESLFSRGSTMPTLKEWDTTRVLKDMDTINKICGYGRGITSGYALSPQISLDSPICSLIPLEPDECPLNKVPEYLEYCKYQLGAFKRCIKSLKERVDDDADDEDDEVDDEDYEVDYEDDGDESDDEEYDEDYDEAGDKDEVKGDDDSMEDGVDDTLEGSDEDSEVRRESRTKMRYDDKNICLKLSSPDVPHNSDEDKKLITYVVPDDAIEDIKPEAMVNKEVKIGCTPPSFNLATPIRTEPPEVDECSKYISKRKRKKKPSRYLQSPYDGHVAQSNASILDKNLVTYIWSPDQPSDQMMYQCQMDHKFNLNRVELWTLQEEEYVSSLVIDSWINMLNFSQRNDKLIRRLVMTVGPTLFTSAAVSKKISLDNKEDKAQAFQKRLAVFNSYMSYRRLNVLGLEYILIPSIARSHFVTYVLNLKMRRFEYLTSLEGFARVNKSGTFSEFQVLGDILMSEACSFIQERYNVLNIPCPYKWEQFEWHDPTMPQQPDGTSCGVFTMIFLKEWQGNENDIESFRNWDRLSKNQKNIATNKFRIDLCCSIMNHKSNLLKESIQVAANNFCDQLQAEIKTCGGQKKAIGKRKKM